MIVEVARRVALELPTGWRELPPPAVLATGAWICEWVEESKAPVECRADLADSLAVAADFVLMRSDDERAWILMTDPTDSVVIGLASVAVQHPVSAAIEAEAERFVEAPITVETASLWARLSAPTTLAGFPASVAHDIVQVEYPAGLRITERYVGTVFPDAGIGAVQLEIDAGSLDAFDDIVAFGDAVLGTLMLVDEA